MVKEKIMKLFPLVNQDINRNFLNKIIQNDKIANGYLFFGAEGSGYEGFAMEFAAMLNCHSSETKPCNNCPSCHKMKTLEHANVILVFPLPTGKKTSSENPYNGFSEEQIQEIQYAIQEKAKNPYKKIKIEKARSIPISLIRYVKRNLYLSSHEIGWKVVIVFDAHLMTIESSNAFLKMLEEPPEKTTIILTTSQKSKILPTIISRIKPMFFPPLSVNEIKIALNKKDVENDQLDLLINLSGGNISRALDLDISDIDTIKKMTLEFLRYIAGWNVKEIYYLIPKLVKQYNENPDTLYQILLSIKFWFRDASVIKSQAKNVKLIHSDQAKTIENFVNGYPDFDSFKINESIDNCIDFISRNVYINLAIIELIFNIKKLIGHKKQ